MLNGLIAGIKTRCGGVISCLYSGATDDDGIVLIDPGPEVIAHLSLRLGEIDVETLDPRTFFLVELDQGQRLRIMHHHEMVRNEVAHTVVQGYLFKNLRFVCRY